MGGLEEHGGKAWWGLKGWIKEGWHSKVQDLAWTD